MKPDLPTDPARWQRIEALLDEMFERPAGERRAFLDEACVGDPDLRAQMEFLLKADEEAGEFLGKPFQEVSAALLADTSGDVASLADRCLGPYRLVREIGCGGMGVVYEAEDTRLRRRVAVKLLPPEYSRAPAAKERFLREARAASALDDPNICTVHDIGEHEGQLYIVMAYYEGETLKERLAKGPLPVSEARQVAIEVARALARAHEAGIVHRDIKPANVMLTCQGKVKVLDFGIAKMKGDTTLTRTGNSPGTPAYMSPEQARGELVDGRSDLWSLGALLYEMLAGRRPFPGDDERAVLSSIQRRKPEPLERIRPGVPPELVRMVEKALAKDPAQRYQSAAELLGDLEDPRRRIMSARGLRVVFLAGVVAAGLLLGFLVKGSLRRIFPPPQVKVAVLHPVTSSEDPEHVLVASDVMEAVLATLISFDRVHPIDPPHKEESSGSEAERLRRAEADEVIVPLLNCRGDQCRVMLRRVRESDREVLEVAKPFEIETGIENVQGLAEAVQVHLRQLYPERRLRSGLNGGEVRPEDYATYAELDRRATSRTLGREDLDRLDVLLRTSPGLVGAYRLATDVARGLNQFDRAIQYASRAEALAPNDPRPLFSRFRAEIAGRRLQDAQKTLGRLKLIAPSDASVLVAEAELLEARDELKEAHRIREKIILRRPLWPQVLALASLEFRQGDNDSARRRLDELIKQHPDNQYVLQTVALVALYQDQERAARLYEELVRLRPDSARSYLTNIGFIRYLLGDYAAAEKADRRALEMEPRHLLTRFNLAAALEAQGKSSEARRLYRVLDKELEATPDLDVRTRMLRAQCLVRLGQRDEANRLAEEVLHQVPEDFQGLHQAAQLYALLGKRHYALYYTQRALEKELGRAWFSIPEFNSLKDDQSFQDLLHAPQT